MRLPSLHIGVAVLVLAACLASPARAQDERQPGLPGKLESLESWMVSTGDLRYSEPQTIYWDTVTYTPEYQHAAYDLDLEIAAYQMQKRMPNGRMVKQDCQ